MQYYFRKKGAQNAISQIEFVHAEMDSLEKLLFTIRSGKLKAKINKNIAD